MLNAAAENAVKKFAIEMGIIKPVLSKTEAYEKFGKANVDRWIKEGLLKPHRDGNHTAKFRINRYDLELLAISSNRTTALQTED